MKVSISPISICRPRLESHDRTASGFKTSRESANVRVKGGKRISPSTIDRIFDNSNRRQYGMGIVGRFFGWVDIRARKEEKTQCTRFNQKFPRKSKSHCLEKKVKNSFFFFFIFTEWKYPVYSLKITQKVPSNFSRHLRVIFKIREKIQQNWYLECFFCETSAKFEYIYVYIAFRNLSLKRRKKYGLKAWLYIWTYICNFFFSLFLICGT